MKPATCIHVHVIVSVCYLYLPTIPFHYTPLPSCGLLQPDQHVVWYHHRAMHFRVLPCHVCRTQVNSYVASSLSSSSLSLTCSWHWCVMLLLGWTTTCTCMHIHVHVLYLQEVSVYNYYKCAVWLSQYGMVTYHRWRLVLLFGIPPTVMLYSLLSYPHLLPPQLSPLHSRFEYHWADGTTVKKPIKCSAPKYIDYLMTWVQEQLDDENIFPSKIGMCR